MEKDFELFNLISEPIAVISADNNLLFSNESFNELFGLDYSPYDVSKHYQDFFSSFEKHQASSSTFVLEIALDHRRYLYEFKWKSSTQANIAVIHGQDITQLRKTQQLLRSSTSNLEKYSQKMHELAHLDQLTGIANRRSLFSQFNEISIKQPNGNWAVSILDIDYFKRCNDHYGHSFGDDVLRVFSEEIQSRLPDACIFARLGGEEFCLLQPDANSEVFTELLTQLLNSIQKLEIGTPCQSSLTLSFSAGFTQSGTQHQPLDELLKQADRALYFAKENGRSRIVPFTELQSQYRANCPTTHFTL
ncbi:GGDEF domain-containing protein [Vibrio sp. T187]|uniref:GGDEF domain-containing protein n=1 Tax=Vibrio TaxID=662 RepID=UPI0010C99434|nr:MULTISPECIES: GGDEF domain-containing protein [Vibrio]MBW3696840.1 GGDEF domain-containing protein [Vibrio sp. T187]